LPDKYIANIQEDSPLEYFQAIFYFSASIFTLIISRRFINNRFKLHGILYFLLFVGLLFVSLEEISWGQRIFNLRTPSFFIMHNMQKEISIHNLKPVQDYFIGIYILVGLYGSFLWLFLRKIKIKNDHIVNFIVPEWFLSSYFYLVLLIYTYFFLVYTYFKFCTFGIHGFHLENPGAFVIWRDQEPAEFLLSLGFLIFSIVNNIKSKSICSRIALTRIS